MCNALIKCTDTAGLKKNGRCLSWQQASDHRVLLESNSQRLMLYKTLKPATMHITKLATSGFNGMGWPLYI